MNKKLIVFGLLACAFRISAFANVQGPTHVLPQLDAESRPVQDPVELLRLERDDLSVRASELYAENVELQNVVAKSAAENQRLRAGITAHKLEVEFLQSEMEQLQSVASCYNNFYTTVLARVRFCGFFSCEHESFQDWYSVMLAAGFSEKEGKATVVKEFMDGTEEYLVWAAKNYDVLKEIAYLTRRLPQLLEACAIGKIKPDA